MRRRVEEHIPAKQADREIKLGRGGLRDVEFAVQLLQLVHGRSDVTLRSPATLATLEALATWGYVGREDASSMANAYRFLRILEHRVQLRQMRRTHLFPERVGVAGHRPFDGDAHRPSGRDRRCAFGKMVSRFADCTRKLFTGLCSTRWPARFGEARLTPKLLRATAGVGVPGTPGCVATPGIVDQRCQPSGRHPAHAATGHAQGGSPTADPGRRSVGISSRKILRCPGSHPWYLRLLRDESTVERMAHLLASSAGSRQICCCACAGAVRSWPRTTRTVTAAGGATSRPKH